MVLEPSCHRTIPTAKSLVANAGLLAMGVADLVAPGRANIAGPATSTTIATVSVLGCINAGTFLRRLGHQSTARVRQLLGGPLAGPGDSPLTIDLDSNLQTVGQGEPRLCARVSPLLAKMSRLREGRANTARGAAHFLRCETLQSAVWPRFAFEGCLRACGT